MKTHDRQFVYRVVHFDRVFPNLYSYHSSRAITVEQNGTAKKFHWPVATHKVSEITTETHQLQQNLQLKSLAKKSFGAWTCNHSKIPHLTARPNRKAANRDTTATQQTKSITPYIVRRNLKPPQSGNRRKGASKIDCLFRTGNNPGKCFRPVQKSG